MNGHQFHAETVGEGQDTYSTALAGTLAVAGALIHARAGAGGSAVATHFVLGSKV